MNMTKIALSVATALSFLLVGPMAAAEEAKAEDVPKMIIKIDEMTCREMLKMAGDEQDFTVIFLHGFISGKKSELVFDSMALSEATDRVLDSCIDNPDDKLLAVFEKARG